ncbi:MAG: SGNH/GDSL hydrolase family protein [Candidatus Omnitrophica bacterium]|nr:SGNH/GDSL hydrolase family protein [Candidatus Omnitrophota bacterium]
MGLLTMCLSTGLTLVVCEVLLRFFTPPPIPAGFVGNCENARRYGWGYPPHFPLPAYDPDLNEIVAYDRTNSQGWKDVEHSFEKSEGTTRILVVGDSYTQGLPPLEHVYHRVLKRLLREEGFRVEVIAMGHGGWATDQGFQAFLQEGTRYSPDIVISQFCINDLEGLAGYDPFEDTKLKPFRYRLEGNQLIFEERPRPDTRGTIMERLVRFMALHSRIYFTLLKAQKNQFVRPHDPSKDLWFLRVQPRSGGFWKKGEDDPNLEPLWNLYGAILSEWSQKCVDSDIQFYVYSEAFDASEREFLLNWDLIEQEGEKLLARNQNDEWEEIDFDKPIWRWSELCQDLGVVRIPRKRDYSRYKNDPHTNIEGNLLMAEDIRDFLLEDPNARKRLESNR